ncbi:hypothetical protein BJX76DRAFT_134148 [Aspergillus varians]
MVAAAFRPATRRGVRSSKGHIILEDHELTSVSIFNNNPSCWGRPGLPGCTSRAGVLPVNLTTRTSAILSASALDITISTAATNDGPVLKIRERLIDVCASGWKADDSVAIKEIDNIGLFPLRGSLQPACLRAPDSSGSSELLLHKGHSQALAGPVGDGDWIRIHPRSSLLHQTSPQLRLVRRIGTWLDLPGAFHSHLFPFISPFFQISFKLDAGIWKMVAWTDAVLPIGPRSRIIHRAFIFGEQSKPSEVFPFSNLSNRYGQPGPFRFFMSTLINGHSPDANTIIGCGDPNVTNTRPEI